MFVVADFYGDIRKFFNFLDYSDLFLGDMNRPSETGGAGGAMPHFLTSKISIEMSNIEMIHLLQQIQLFL